MMKATECKWFGCVYAMKDGCSIHGWLDSGDTEECRHYKVDCIRFKCEYCRRAGEKGVCPLESEG